MANQVGHRCARTREKRPALDSAGGTAADVASVDLAALYVFAVAALEPQESGEPHEAQQALIKAVVVLRVGRHGAGVLRRYTAGRAGSGEAEEEKRAKRCSAKQIGPHNGAFS